MKLQIVVITIFLIGIKTQSTDSWESSWSTGTFNTSGDNNLSLDSLLGSQDMSANWSSSSSDNMDWSNTATQGSSSGQSSGSSMELNWSNVDNSSQSVSGSDWFTNGQENASLNWLNSSSANSNIDVLNPTFASTNLDWSNSASTNTSETVNTQKINTQVYYDKPEITQTQTLITKPIVQKKIISQPIITQKIVQQPIIKQRVVQTPVIRKKVVQRPVYTETQNLQPIVDSKTVTRTVPINVPGKTTVRETYYQPTVLTKDVQLQINRGQTQVNNMPVQTRPVQYQEEVVNKVVQAPAKEIYTQPIYQKQIINNTEKVDFVKQQPVYQQRAPIYREPIVQERTRYETITRPGREIYNNTYIQPYIQRENVNVQFNRQPDRHVQLEQVHAPAQYNYATRTETVQVPGNQIITQPVVQRIVHQNNIHHIQQPVVQRVPVHRPYPVPTPVIKKVPIIRRIPIPVYRKRNNGTKIINLSKVTINGSSRSKKRSEESNEYDYYNRDNYYNNRSRYGYQMTSPYNYYNNYNRNSNYIRLPRHSGKFYETGNADLHYGRTYHKAQQSNNSGYNNWKNNSRYNNWNNDSNYNYWNSSRNCNSWNKNCYGNGYSSNMGHSMYGTYY